MTDEEPPQFDHDNPNQWGILISAFELAPYVFGPPVALHVIRADGTMSYMVGVLTSTEDHHEVNKTTPSRSMFYFQDADDLPIEWSKVVAVFGMVAMTEDAPVEHA